MKRVGAVIVFQEGVTLEQVQEALMSTDLHGTKLEAVLETAELHEYDPTYGGPVWYIP